MDLSDKQQDEMHAIHLKEAEHRKAMHEKRKSEKIDRSEMSGDEIFERRNARLDHMIALQSEVKSVLSDEQFDKWQKMMRKKLKEGKYKNDATPPKRIMVRPLALDC